MQTHIKILLLVLVFVVVRASSGADGAVSRTVWQYIDGINLEGPYYGIVVPNSFELNPLLQSPSYVPHNRFPYLDFAGRRFRIATVAHKRVIVVMTGLSMLNAGITTQLLVSLFKIKGVLHIGIAGNANPKLQIGDVTIPQYWAHTGLWNWQRFGDGPDDELALESNGDYTRSIGYLRFSDFDTETKNTTPAQNQLNNIWFQPEEVFPIDGNPEMRQHVFWVPTNELYFSLAEKLEGMKLGSCVNSTCLPRTPMVIRVENGISSSIFVDNAAYREFLYSKFNATAIDMESAAVALICLQQRTPFIAIRALSDLAGGGSSVSNEAATFASLAAQNAVDVLISFISYL